MDDNTLLNEAMLDARLVKETAVANAMLTLQDAFKPHLDKMLLEQLTADDDTDLDEQTALDSSGIGSAGVTSDDPAPKKPASGASSSSKIDNPGHENKELGNTSALKETQLPPTDDAQAPVPTQPTVPTPGEDAGEGDDNNELDLEAIIKELEADLAGDSGLSLPAPTDTPPEAPEQEELPPAPVRETLEGSGDEGIHKDGKDVKDVHGVPGGKAVSTTTEEIDLDEIMREIGADQAALAENNIVSENAVLKEKIGEFRNVVQLLRSRLHEVTLLNSKLMYTTKLFRHFNLSEDQKKRIIEQFNRTNTVREAKLVYSTLAESLTAKPLKNTSVSKITEGASKAISSTKPSQTIIAESTKQIAEMHRLQKLAGIIQD